MIIGWQGKAMCRGLVVLCRVEADVARRAVCWRSSSRSLLEGEMCEDY